MLSDGEPAGLVAVAAVVATALLAYLRARTPSNPGAYFGIVWLTATLPAVVLVPSAVGTSSLFVIAAFMLSAVLGSVVGEGTARANPSLRSKVRVDAISRAAVRCSVIGGTGGLLAAVSYLADSGYALREMTRGETWVAIAGQYSLARYHEGFVEPFTTRLLLATNYAGALFGGLALAGRWSRWRTAAAALPILASVLVTLITTAKGSLLISMLLTASAGLAGKLWLAGSWGRRGRAAVAAAVLVVILATVVSLGLRYGSDESDLGSTIRERMGGYVVGHVAAFSAWLQWEGLWESGGGWGQSSFAGLAELLGLTTRVPGIYRELALNPVAAESNVFTAFRGLIVDFTFPGALLAVVLASAAAGCAWRRMQDGGGGARSFLGLVCYFVFVGWSPVISAFVYNVILLALAAFALVVVGLESAGSNE